MKVSSARRSSSVGCQHFQTNSLLKLLTSFHISQVGGIKFRLEAYIFKRRQNSCVFFIENLLRNRKLDDANTAYTC